MTSLAEFHARDRQFAHTTAVLGGDLWGDPTEAEMRRMDAETDAARLRDLEQEGER